MSHNAMVSEGHARQRGRRASPNCIITGNQELRQDRQADWLRHVPDEALRIAKSAATHRRKKHCRERRKHQKIANIAN